MAEHYELEPEAPKPKLPGYVLVRGTAGEVADAVANDLYLHAMNCVRQFGDFHMALPRGESAFTLYRTLLIDPAYRDMPWKRTHVWSVSGKEGDTSTEETIRDFLVQHGDIPSDQFHPMPMEARDADVRYTKALREHLGWREKGHDRLDFVLLGVGPDSSTADYLPSAPIIEDGDSLVTVNRSGAERTMSLTMRVINASRFVAVIATGEHKEPGIRLMSSADANRSPLSKVSPVGGVLKWYLDESACPTNGDAA
ncbi:MAG: hypothetical protein ED559_08260 [Phycisphaera sp.]|nr:MAG: hypothetical protein ED559_08260 [Phycisphaera sp.]